MMHVLIVYLLLSHNFLSPVSHNALLKGQGVDFCRPKKEKKIYSYVIIFKHYQAILF
jgi:hypothetical protein